MSGTMRDHLADWRISLEAAGKSPQTVKTYTDGVARFLEWCEETGTDPVLVPATVERFQVALAQRGNKAATVASRQLSLKRFSVWLEREGLGQHQLDRLEKPKLDDPVEEPLSEDELRALIKACRGTDFRDRRDEAIVRLMAETGLRAESVVRLATGDIDKASGKVVVRRAKGGRGYLTYVSAKTREAIVRYERMRREHRLADQTDQLFLGERGKGFTYDGLHKSLRMRADRAGIARFHPHLLRITWAIRWSSAGGRELDLMHAGGWTRLDMVQRYTRHDARERALEEARRLNLGDL